MKNYLEFEKEIKALEQEVDGLKSPFGSEGISEVDTQKIKNTQNDVTDIKEDIVHIIERLDYTDGTYDSIRYVKGSAIDKRRN